MSALRSMADRLPAPLYDLAAMLHYRRKIARSTLADEPDLKFLSQFVRPGSVCIDVGACIGLYTRHLSELCGAAGRVISFEPNSRTFGYLRHTVAKLGLDNVTLVHGAASDRSGTVSISVPRRGSHESIYESVVVPGGDVPCRTLDSLGLERVDFIKIDAEGHEPLVLRGAPELLARDRPVILMERNDEAHALLAGLGYRAQVTGPDCLLPYTGTPTTNMWYTRG